MPYILVSNVTTLASGRNWDISGEEIFTSGQYVHTKTVGKIGTFREKRFLQVDNMSILKRRRNCRIYRGTCKLYKKFQKFLTVELEKKSDSIS